MSVFDCLDRYGSYKKNYKYIFFNYDYKIEKVVVGQISEVYLEKQIDIFYNRIVNISNSYKNFSNLDSKLGQIKINGKYLSVLKFPCLIPKKILENDINKLTNRSYLTKIIMYSFYKFTYYISELSIKGVQDQFQDYIEWNNYSELTDNIIRLSNTSLENFFEVIMREVNFKKNYDSFNDHSWIKNIIDLGSKKNLYDAFYDKLKKLIEDIANNPEKVNNLLGNKREEKQDAYSYFGLSKNCSYEDFKKAYREMSKKYHPDFGRNPDEKEMMKINKLKMIIEEDLKG
ncbi:DnaJ domain-containing protein [Spiroplasma sp. BIUS-1]|uniref:DnaJ domain-containing protein n=1 Tax=Spiroplasma sp. BIUS-1 TaxID=216964 RepID=UPI0013971A48|nr:DnaJ domain-containing protein [Spiroplasma sp. BIUS-1]QHX36764.1 hypothetical protein SBIUS_v1c05110 [Spiroplasma sp. BIUS-1]